MIIDREKENGTLTDVAGKEMIEFLDNNGAVTFAGNRDEVTCDGLSCIVGEESLEPVGDTVSGALCSLGAINHEVDVLFSDYNLACYAAIDTEVVSFAGDDLVELGAGIGLGSGISHSLIAHNRYCGA